MQIQTKLFCHKHIQVWTEAKIGQCYTHINTYAFENVDYILRKQVQTKQSCLAINRDKSVNKKGRDMTCYIHINTMYIVCLWNFEIESPPKKLIDPEIFFYKKIKTILWQCCFINDSGEHRNRLRSLHVDTMACFRSTREPWRPLCPFESFPQTLRFFQ